MYLFCLNGYNGERLSMEFNEIFGFPDNISYDGGYDMVCTLKIDAGCFHVESENLYSATGALYRFCDELKVCYDKLHGTAEYRMLLEDDLSFKIAMTNGGRAFVKGTFQERRHDQNNVLHFEFDTDQSCFFSVIQDIEKLKEKYGDEKGMI